MCEPADGSSGRHTHLLQTEALPLSSSTMAASIPHSCSMVSKALPLLLSCPVTPSCDSLLLFERGCEDLLFPSFLHPLLQHPLMSLCPLCTLFLTPLAVCFSQDSFIPLLVSVPVLAAASGMIVLFLHFRKQASGCYDRQLCGNCQR